MKNHHKNRPADWYETAHDHELDALYKIGGGSEYVNEDYLRQLDKAYRLSKGSESGVGRIYVQECYGLPRQRRRASKRRRARFRRNCLLIGTICACIAGLLWWGGQI